ncbi:MAG: hypothetical protein JSR54_09885, partial [Proteobacteria bacterium]|nr:hypothetical protein [Pseudomonadota bacterium]
MAPTRPLRPRLATYHILGLGLGLLALAARAELMASERWQRARMDLERAAEARPTLVLDG